MIGNSQTFGKMFITITNLGTLLPAIMITMVIWQLSSSTLRKYLNGFTHQITMTSMFLNQMPIWYFLILSSSSMLPRLYQPLRKLNYWFGSNQNFRLLKIHLGLLLLVIITFTLVKQERKKQLWEMMFYHFLRNTKSICTSVDTTILVNSFTSTILPILSMVMEVGIKMENMIHTDNHRLFFITIMTLVVSIN